MHRFMFASPSLYKALHTIILNHSKTLHQPLFNIATILPSHMYHRIWVTWIYGLVFFPLTNDEFIGILIIEIWLKIHYFAQVIFERGYGVKGSLKI